MLNLLETEVRSALISKRTKELTFAASRDKEITAKLERFTETLISSLEQNLSAMDRYLNPAEIQKVLSDFYQYQIPATRRAAKDPERLREIIEETLNMQYLTFKEIEAPLMPYFHCFDPVYLPQGALIAREMGVSVQDILLFSKRNEELFTKLARIAKDRKGITDALRPPYLQSTFIEAFPSIEDYQAYADSQKLFMEFQQALKFDLEETEASHQSTTPLGWFLYETERTVSSHAKAVMTVLHDFSHRTMAEEIYSAGNLRETTQQETPEKKVNSKN
jgi:hypothetical protein